MPALLFACSIKNLVDRPIADKGYSRLTSQEADIILTTCRAAKGLKWDNVELCDDFLKLGEFERDGRDKFVWSNVYKKYDRVFIDTSSSWIFKLVNYKHDETNALYVACSRAKHCLSIPPSLAAALEPLDSIREKATLDEDNLRAYFSAMAIMMMTLIECVSRPNLLWLAREDEIAVS